MISLRGMMQCRDDWAERSKVFVTRPADFQRIEF